MVKNKLDNWYFRLMCGHLRLISRKKIDVTYGETSVYCRLCDNFSIVKERAERF